MISVSIVETRSPPIIVHPKGAHRDPPRRVNGSNPPMVVNEVSIMGVKRVSPAI